MKLLGYPLCLKPYFLLDTPHMLEFFACFWDDNIEELHGSDRCANINTTIVLGALQTIGNIFHTLTELGCILRVSTVQGVIFYSLGIGLEFILIFLWLLRFARCCSCFNFFDIADDEILINCTR